MLYRSYSVPLARAPRSVLLLLAGQCECSMLSPEARSTRIRMLTLAEKERVFDLLLSHCLSCESIVEQSNQYFGGMGLLMTYATVKKHAINAM